MGIAQGALERSIAHARERVQFGKPIADLAPIQFMIADMATAVEAARLLTREAAQLLDEKDKKGALLGGMAKNLSLEINSFEKNYVGNLTRRVGTLLDFIKLKNEIEQKLIMHDKAKYTFQTSYDLAQKIKEFKSRYDKEECAFGFMESYFKP